MSSTFKKIFDIPPSLTKSGLTINRGFGEELIIALIHVLIIVLIIT